MTTEDGEAAGQPSAERSEDSDHGETSEMRSISSTRHLPSVLTMMKTISLGMPLTLKVAEDMAVPPTSTGWLRAKFDRSSLKTVDDRIEAEPAQDAAFGGTAAVERFDELQEPRREIGFRRLASKAETAGLSGEPSR